jgi:hypothetical protein
MPHSGIPNYYNFNLLTINRVVPQSIGVYILGYYDGTSFKAQYVGRSDYNLRSRLISHLNENYSHFKFQQFDSRLAAFEKECILYHDFNPPNNINHPAQPQGISCNCPRCGFPNN